MSVTRFDFEKPIVELEEELKKLRAQYERLHQKKRAADEKARLAREAAEEKARVAREAAEEKARAAAAAAAESAALAGVDLSAINSLGIADAAPTHAAPGPDTSAADAETSAPAASSESAHPAAPASEPASAQIVSIRPEGEAPAEPAPPVAPPVAPADAPVAAPEEDDPVDPKLARRIRELEAAIVETRIEVYSDLTVWQRVQIARHPQRPHALDYIQRIFTDFVELGGDRAYGDDRAIVAGLARFNDRPVVVIGQQKGSDTKDNLRRNFGMMHPEGYRKALRVMRMAEKFHMPVVVLIDTPGAYPGIGAEERGQGEAIGRNILEMGMLRTPIVCAVIGEGASGGALGVGVGDRLLMLKYAWYCVISPEGCATILWRDAGEAPRAAEALRLSSDDLFQFGIVDEIVPEPLGGAHRDPAEAAEHLRDAIGRHLEELLEWTEDELVERRFERYRRVGEAWLETTPAASEVGPPAPEPADG